METIYALLLEGASTVAASSQANELGLIKDLMTNLNLDPWDWVACFAAVLSVIVAVVTAWFQYRTEGNTQKMSSAMQVARLKGFYRHMYRNMVKIRAIQVLLEREYANGKYRVPSAEHLLKLKLADDDICEEAFYSDSVIFEKLKELKLQVRNVNVEVDVADRYMSTPQASRAAREEILNTLLFKQGQIGATIKDILTNNFGETGICQFVKGAIDDSFADSLEKNKECEHGKLSYNERFNGSSKMIDLYVEGAKSKVDSDSKDNKNPAQTFYDFFNTDVEIELGKNLSGSPKIVLI